VECRDVRDRELIERYLLGTLDEAERDAFEGHYFECDQCFREAEAMRGVQLRLAAERRDQPKNGARRKGPSRRWWWGLAAAAAVLLSVVAVVWWTSTAAPPRTVALSPELRALARIEPPYYEPIRLRGATDRAHQAFRAAMEHYAAGDHGAAIPGLEEAARLDPDAPNISFFLGACELLAGRTSEGIATLEHTVDLGDTPFLEEALLLRAKGLLQLGEVEPARDDLQAAIDLHGDFEAEAEKLLEALPQ